MPATLESPEVVLTHDSYSDVMARIGNHRILSHDEEIKLAKRIERGDFKAKTYFTEHNFRLVRKVAIKYLGKGLTLNELLNEGVIGLIRAVEKFDWRKGWKFSTYAIWWIRQSIQRATENTGRTIRIPVHQEQALLKMGKVERQLIAELGREPTIGELAAELGWGEERVELLQISSQEIASLDKEVGEDGNATFGESLEDTSSPPIEEEVEDAARTLRLRSMVANLPQDEAEVIELFFGTGPAGKMTLGEIAQHMGIPYKRVVKLRDQGLARLAKEYGPELRVLFAYDDPDQLPPSQEAPVELETIAA